MIVINFVHKHNIESKIDGNYQGKGTKIKKFFDNKYTPFHKSMEDECATENLDFEKITKLINNYITDLTNFEKINKITSQSKFRSSFLEEISSYLFMNLKDIQSGKLGIFNKGIYAGLKIGADLKVTVLKKDVDFCIGKKVTIEIEGNKNDIILPLVAVEVKTYLDATMFGEVQFSSKTIKNATPSVKNYVFMETNEVSEEKILAARHDNILSEMFVLKKDIHSPIKKDVLEDYYNEIVNAVREISSEESVQVPGRLINVNKE